MKRSATTSRTNRTRRAASRRRGVAMLLVLIALGTATVLSGSYLMSRRTAPVIGANAETSSNAKWAARSGANLAVAMLQTSYEVGGSVEDSQLLSGLAIGVGSADAMVTNLTGNTLGDESRVLVSAIGSAESIGALNQRVLLRRSTNKVTEALDPYMSEFAVYATDRLRLQSGSYVAPWPDSTRGPSLFVANIGVGFASSGNLGIDNAGNLTSARLIVDDSATASLVAASESDAFGGGLDAGVQFPTASDRVPDDLDDLSTSGPPVYVWNPGTTHKASRPDYGDVTVTLACTFLLDEEVSPIYTIDDLTIDLTSRVLIQGNVRILIRDDLILENRARIELADEDSSVVFYIRGDLELDNAVIGLPESIASNTSRSYTHLSGSFNTAAIRMRVIDEEDGGKGTPKVELKNRSMVVADIHAPSADVDLGNSSVIIGRLTGGDIRMQNTSIVFYDHSLNPGAGITNPNGPLYSSSRANTLRNALASFDNSRGLTALTQHIRDEFAADGVDPDPEEEGPVAKSDPDPRDGGKVTIVPMRRGAARSIESGGTGATFDTVIFAEAGSTLSQTLSGVLGVLRITADADEDAKDEEKSEGGLVGGVLAGLLGGG